MNSFLLKLFMDVVCALKPIIFSFVLHHKVPNCNASYPYNFSYVLAIFEYFVLSYYRYRRTKYNNGNFTSEVTSLNIILIVLLTLYISFTFHTIDEQIIEIVAHIIANLSLYNSNIEMKSLLIWKNQLQKREFVLCFNFC